MQRAGDAAGPQLDVELHVLALDDVGHSEPPARLLHAKGLGQDAPLVDGEIDHAVGDDDVDRGVGQRDLFDVALEDSTFRAPALRLFSLARASISSVMSRP